MKNNLLIMIFVTFCFSSCEKNSGPERSERIFDAVIMQNKILVEDFSYSGYRYAIKEDNLNYVNLNFWAIEGFDSLYEVGFQYGITLKEICINNSESRQDVIGCQLFLVSINSKTENSENFTIKN